MKAESGDCFVRGRFENAVLGRVKVGGGGGFRRRGGVLEVWGSLLSSIGIMDGAEDGPWSSGGGVEPSNLGINWGGELSSLGASGGVGLDAPSLEDREGEGLGVYSREGSGGVGLGLYPRSGSGGGGDWEARILSPG